ncbi:hypothetical protein StoSoilB5_04420 [Arthrobacter sp. StoSoilB5]|jgi:hypothetical protein|nr:hypothetical protein StoSoilB5_04420 [Arthrobacter sp. StoSoilB5]
MHKACPLSALAPGEASGLDTAPPIAVFHAGRRQEFPERRYAHRTIMVIESEEAPNLPPGRTLQGHV